VKRLLDHLVHMEELAIDYFQFDGQLLVNEMAPRVHNAEVLAIAGAHMHLYGKVPRPRRKLGHITFALIMTRV